MSPSAPDDEFDEPTPPAVDIPHLPPGASPLDRVHHDFVCVKNEIAWERFRRVKMGGRLGQIGEANREQLTKLREFQLRTEGEDNKNGRIGNLTGALVGAKKLIAAIAVAALGSVGLAVAAIYGAGEARGTERLRLEQVERAAESNRAAIERLNTLYLRGLLKLPAATGDVP